MRSSGNYMLQPSSGLRSVGRRSRSCDSLHGVHGDVAGKVAPPGDELGAVAALDDFPDGAGVLQVDLGGDGVLQDDGAVLVGLLVGLDAGGGVPLLLLELVGPSLHLGGPHDDRGGAVTDFFVLSPGDLDHCLGRWVLHGDLPHGDGRLVSLQVLHLLGLLDGVLLGLLVPQLAALDALLLLLLGLLLIIHPLLLLLIGLLVLGLVFGGLDGEGLLELADEEVLG